MHSRSEFFKDEFETLELITKLIRRKRSNQLLTNQSCATKIPRTGIFRLKATTTATTATTTTATTATTIYLQDTSWMSTCSKKGLKSEWHFKGQVEFLNGPTFVKRVVSGCVSQGGWQNFPFSWFLSRSLILILAKREDQTLISIATILKFSDSGYFLVSIIIFNSFYSSQ